MIYCVEDERNIRELLVYTLHSTGFEAKGLENGEQLFEELGNLIPDLILLDIMLPGDDGYTILAKIRQMPEVPAYMTPLTVPVSGRTRARSPLTVCAAP